MNTRANSHTAKSIAVLPFVNMSADPDNEYFSDGITEEIINALTKVQNLKVTARTSAFAFKNKNIDIRIIGRQLGVSTILEGSVRTAGNRVRVTAQLIRTEDGFHLWSKNFNGVLDDIFELQDEISLLIADQIRENFGHIHIQDHLIEAPTRNIAAYDLYLKARYNHLKWNSEGITNGIKYYQQCIIMDPDFALPYFGIGYSLAMRASFSARSELLETAEEYLKKGFERDDRSHLGHFGLATLHFWGKWDFIKGHQFFQKALSLNPSYTEAEEGLTELYSAVGYFDRALEHARNILSINPLSPNHYFTKGNIHYLQGDFQAALACMESALQIDPHFAHAVGMTQLCYIHLRKYKELDHFLKTQPEAERPAQCRALYKLVNSDEDIEIDLNEVGALIGEDADVALFPWQLFIQVHLGNHDLALDILERAVEKRTGQYVNFMNTPLLAPLHDHPRFQELVRSTFHPSRLPADEQDGSSPDENDRKDQPGNAEIDQLLNRLEQLMTGEEPYLEPTLSLRDLADQLDTHPNKLSWLLNEHAGKNFNEYVNTYRLEAFKVKALDPANQHLTLLGLAYESGFNSKTVFNAFFKKMEGVTPRKWVKTRQ